MFKFYTSIFFIMLYASPTHALICPTLAEIQAGMFQQWHAISTLSDLEIEKKNAQDFFINHGTKFLLAEWMDDVPMQAHCYYCIDSGCGMAEIYLARPHAIQPNKSPWKDKGNGTWQCESSDVNDCPFSAIAFYDKFDKLRSSIVRLRNTACKHQQLQ